MTEDRAERDLAARFEVLRGEDDRLAPSFRSVYDACRRNAPPRRRRLFILIAAAAAIPIVLAVLILRRPTEADASAIAAWTSPTESLLDTPGSELYGQAPPVTEPLPEWIFDSKAPSSTPPALSPPESKGVSS
jgi:hypothetical protein